MFMSRAAVLLIATSTLALASCSAEPDPIPPDAGATDTASDPATDALPEDADATVPDAVEDSGTDPDAPEPDADTPSEDASADAAPDTEDVKVDAPADAPEDVVPDSLEDTPDAIEDVPEPDIERDAERDAEADAEPDVPRTCESIEAEYEAAAVGATACDESTECAVLYGHCGVGLGGCYYAANSAAVQDVLNNLEREWSGMGCSFGRPVCDCAHPPEVGCSDGVCEMTF